MSLIVSEQTVSEQYEYVIGVDTHAATHTFALVAAATGALLAHAELPTSPTGLSRAQSWLQQRVSERATLIVVEGTGSFGAIVTERLQRAGLSVVEAARMPAGDRRGIGKNDELDATWIARAVLGLPLTGLRTPRELSSERARVAMRVLVVAREQMTGERTRTINTLTALVRTVDLGVDARRPLTARQITMIAGWRDRDEEATTATCRREAVRLARRVRTLDEDLARSRADITELIPGHPAAARAVRRRPCRCGQRAHCLVVPGRVRSEASLAENSPIPASSGNTVRHRLNRGGDRRLNRALTTITIVRMRIDPATRAYVARRRAEGRTTKERDVPHAAVLAVVGDQST